jgi:lysozyme
VNLALIEADLERDEGYRQHPYKDTAGKLTIGIGLNLTDVGLTRDEALSILRGRVSDLDAQLDGILPWYDDLSEPRQRALVNMAFNLGVNGLMGFRDMIEALKDRDYESAAAEALASKWAKQTPARAKRVAEMIRNG